MSAPDSFNFLTEQETSEKLDAFLRYLRLEGTIGRAARKAGLNPNTVRQWRKDDPLFDEEVKAARAYLVDEAEGTLVDLMRHSDSEKLRFSAASLILRARHEDYQPRTRKHEHVHRAALGSSPIPRPLAEPAKIEIREITEGESSADESAP